MRTDNPGFISRSQRLSLCRSIGFAFVGIVFLFSDKSFASPKVLRESPQLERCLDRADELPDMAAAEAMAWIKKDNSLDAHVCKAFAQANRGMHADAGHEFWYLASQFESAKTKDAARAVSMHNLAGQEFLLAKDPKKAEAQFTMSLNLVPDNSGGLAGRAKLNSDAEHYWDALDDLNRVLKKDPDDVDALRQRGRVWTHLGNPKNAREDLARAASLSGEQ